MVWLYIIGWSTYGPEAAATFAPEYKDTTNDTRKALAVDGRHQRRARVPAADRRPRDDRLRRHPRTTRTASRTSSTCCTTIAGEGFGTFLVVCLCGGLLLSMNTATMDGSRALYALSEEKMTIKQLGVLNRHHVPARAMTVDMLLNIFLAALLREHLLHPRRGQRRLHVLARARALGRAPPAQGPARTGRGRSGSAKPWMVAAGVFCIANLLFIIFGLIFMDYTGYLWNADFTDAWAKLPEMIGVAVGSFACGVIGYVIAQRQHGRPFRWREPSDEQPSQEAIEAAAAPARAR